MVQIHWLHNVIFKCPYSFLLFLLFAYEIIWSLYLLLGVLLLWIQLGCHVKRIYYVRYHILRVYSQETLEKRRLFLHFQGPLL